MRSTDARAWNLHFIIFNDSIIQESSGDPRWLTRRSGDAGGELRKAYRSTPLWTLELSNLQLSAAQHEELLALQYEIQGMKNAFLCRNIRSDKLESEDGTPALLGVGNGIQNDFQLVKRRSIQDRDGQVEIIRFPNFRYPPLKDFNCQDWTPLDELRIYVDGEIVNDGFSVNRETGLVSFDVAPATGAVIEVTGGYYLLLVANVDGIPTKPDGPLFVVTGSVTFAQPEGGADGELQRMGLL